MTELDLTEDGFLGGNVQALQPAKLHHRSGLEAVLLGSAICPSTHGLAVDLGAGVGVAGFCAAQRCPALTVMLAERDPDLIAIARRSLELPANRPIRSRVSGHVADIASPESERLAAGLRREAADFVLCNPPFYRPDSSSASPAGGRSQAHMLEHEISDWLRTAAWLLRPRGTLILIVAASALVDVLGAMKGRFGAAEILPIHSRPSHAAERLILRAVKGRATQPSILPGLVLHDRPGSAFAPGVERLLRGDAWLGDIQPSWQTGPDTPS